MGGIGLWDMVQQVVKYVKGKNYDNEELFIFCYILEAFLGTMAVAALFMIYPGRIDTVAYGRYTDWLGTDIITFGIFNLFLFDRKNAKILL